MFLFLSLCGAERKGPDTQGAWAPRAAFRSASLGTHGPIIDKENIPGRDTGAQGRRVSGQHKAGTVGEGLGLRGRHPS